MCVLCVCGVFVVCVRWVVNACAADMCVVYGGCGTNGVLYVCVVCVVHVCDVCVVCVCVVCVCVCVCALCLGCACGV